MYRSSSGDVWGLLQPFAHLNAGRVASGALALPRWASVASLATCVGSVRELKEKALQCNGSTAAALDQSIARYVLIVLLVLFHFLHVRDYNGIVEV